MRDGRTSLEQLRQNRHLLRPDSALAQSQRGQRGAARQSFRQSFHPLPILSHPVSGEVKMRQSRSSTYSFRKLLDTHVSDSVSHQQQCRNTRAPAEQHPNLPAPDLLSETGIANKLGIRRQTWTSQPVRRIRVSRANATRLAPPSPRSLWLRSRCWSALQVSMPGASLTPPAESSQHVWTLQHRTDSCFTGKDLTCRLHMVPANCHSGPDAITMSDVLLPDMAQRAREQTAEFTSNWLKWPIAKRSPRLTAPESPISFHLASA